MVKQLVLMGWWLTQKESQGIGRQSTRSMQAVHGVWDGLGFSSVLHRDWIRLRVAQFIVFDWGMGWPRQGVYPLTLVVAPVNSRVLLLSLSPSSSISSSLNTNITLCVKANAVTMWTAMLPLAWCWGTEHRPDIPRWIVQHEEGRQAIETWW